MSTRKFSEALGEIDERYIEKALSYRAKKPSASHGKRGVLLLAAAIITVLLVGSAVAVAILHGDLWLQSPTNDPVEAVRSALENQAEKDYTLKIEVKSVEIDETETERVLERVIKGVIADRRGWSDEYLAEHFAVVKAVYDAEYDHTQTTRSDGEVIMYFYLTRDVDSGAWTIVDNSGNVNWSEDDPPDESGEPPAGSTEPVVRSIEEQIFSYLSELFTEAYSPYYDGLHYEISNYEETTDESSVTATFFWTMYYLGKGWDVGTDEGVEQLVNCNLQATATVNGDGLLDLETISVLIDTSAKFGPNYHPVEDIFPTQLAD